jgi:hypothetical protein
MKTYKELNVFESPEQTKPKTNGDEIRKMTDEELAKELTDLIYNAMCSPAFLHGKLSYDMIKEANLEWLKKEVKEDETERIDW